MRGNLNQMNPHTVLMWFSCLGRDGDYYPWRRPLGGGVVAGLPHRWYNHPHVCRPFLVPS